MIPVDQAEDLEEEPEVQAAQVFIMEQPVVQVQEEVQQQLPSAQVKPLLELEHLNIRALLMLSV